MRNATFVISLIICDIKMQAVQSHTPTTILYVKDFKVDFTVWGNASGVHVRALDRYWI